MRQEIHSWYGYIPTAWICYIFLVLFAITTFLHIVEAFVFKPRLYWLLPTIVICGIGEAIGWGARLKSSKNPASYTTFMTQLVTTIISPTFLTAALYTALGGVVTTLGLQYSRLSAKTYIIIFVSADVLALVIQAAGGAIAAGANTRSRRDLGSHIMVGGIFVQMAGITVYALMLTEFLFRFYYQKPVSKRLSPAASGSGSISSPEKLSSPDGRTVNLEGRGVMPVRTGMVVIGLIIGTILVFIRSVYRSVELLGGWDGRIITTEIYFNLLDGTPIVLAMFVLNVLHPGLRPKHVSD